MTTQAHKFPGNRKLHTIKVFDSDGVVLSHTGLLDDDGIRRLQHGIRIAQGVDWTTTRWTRSEALDEYAEYIGGDSRCDLVLERMDTVNDIELLEYMEYMTAEDEAEAEDEAWKDSKWTKQEAIDAYSDCLSNWKKHELIQNMVEEITDDELKAFMVNCNDDEDVRYVSGDDVELDPKTAEQYRADRKADDVPSILLGKDDSMYVRPEDAKLDPEIAALLQADRRKEDEKKWR